MQLQANIVIIGAGVIGLAIAAELAQNHRGVFVLERNHTFGRETSSHNSEVIHAGIYYPEGSLKARLCVEGNRRLYEICQRYNVAHRRPGKIIVATDAGEVTRLEELLEQGRRNGAELRLISRQEVKALEPGVEAVAGLLSPATGIIDAHGLMRLYYGLARQYGAGFAFETEVTGLRPRRNGYEVQVKDREGVSSFPAVTVINAAGLGCERVAALAGIDTARAGYRLHFCKGEYFRLNSPGGVPVSRLVYPLPEHAGKGIHVSLNLDSQVRFGPSAHYVDKVEYSVDPGHRDEFYRAVRRFLPGIRPEHLEPDFAGVRPKLQGPDDDFRDFIIRDEEARGLPGLVDLIGIESPGLTAAPAIARYVAEIVRGLQS